MNARVLTLDQVAEQLQIKPSWLRTQCENRQVPFTMLGGSYRFTEARGADHPPLREAAPHPPYADTCPQERDSAEANPYRLRKVT